MREKIMNKKSLYLKKNILIGFMAALMLMTVACGEKEENSMVKENGFNVELSKENNMDNENKGLEKQDIEVEQEENDNVLSNVNILNGSTYSIISSRVLEDTEYEVDDDGYKAIIVDMIIENHGNEIIDISTVMCFNIVGNSGEEYNVEVFDAITKGKLDSSVAPGKVLRGEFIFQAMEKDQKFTLEIKQNFLSEELAIVGFEENVIYDVAINASSKDGKTIGDEIVMENLSFVVTGTSILQEGDRTILKVDMTAKNNTQEMITEYTIPFVLSNADGYVNNLDIKTDNYVLADIPANGEKETSIYFKLIDPEMKSFDMYLSPFGIGAVDVLHLEVE
jgi:hypothetical protein